MRVLSILLIVVFKATLLVAQTSNPDKERYAIVEAALLADDAFNLHATLDNDRLRTLTNGLKQIKTVDTTITFDEATSARLQAQLTSTSIKMWDKKKIYRFEVTDHDPIAGLDTEGNAKLDSAQHRLKNKIVRLHRASLPLFTDQQSAFLIVSGKVVTFQDGDAILSSNYSKVYFLRLVKKRWKITRFILLSSN